MRKLILLLFTSLFWISFHSSAQIYSSEKFENIEVDTHPGLDNGDRGTCASPEGPMNETTITPPDYTWLQDNGYCNPFAYGTNPTTCWTFTPTSTSVDINSGWAGSGCATYSFSNFILYECDPSCAVVGSGLTFTGLTPGDCYTWCFEGTATGGGFGCLGFTDFCPYYFNNSMLPVEVYSFTGFRNGNINTFKWITITELDNDSWTIEHSTDGKNWSKKAVLPGGGTSSAMLEYEWIDTRPEKRVNYYRLMQTDFDGITTYHGIISMDNSPENPPELVKIVNMFGQDVAPDYRGIKVEIYDDGSTRRVVSQ